MHTQDQIIQPFYTEDGNLTLLMAFARQTIVYLDPTFSPPHEKLTETFEEEPYDFNRTTVRFGTPTRGFETVHYKAYEPRYGGQAVDEVSVQVYGWAEEQQFRLACVRYWNTPRYLKLSVSGPAFAVEAIGAQFNAQFGKLAPNEIQIQNALTSLNLALRQGRWDTARQWAEEIIKHRAQDPQAVFGLGVVYAARQDYEIAENYLTQAVTLAPEHYDAYYNLGVLSHQTNRSLRAIECFQRALQIKPDNAPVLYQLGVAYETLGEIEKAIQAYHDAVRTSPNPGGHWGYSGMDFTQQAEQALARLKKKGT